MKLGFITTTKNHRPHRQSGQFNDFIVALSTLSAGRRRSAVSGTVDFRAYIGDMSSTAATVLNHKGQATERGNE